MEYLRCDAIEKELRKLRRAIEAYTRSKADEIFGSTVITRRLELDTGLHQAALRFVDPSRSIRASSGFAGSAERRIDAQLWYAARDSDCGAGEVADLAAGGPRPLLVYCHGTAGRPDNATYLVTQLARRGYIVVAPNFPLTSTTAFTDVTSPDISDAGEQVRDVRFLLDQLLSDHRLARAIDPARIGSIGHSLGAITCWFLSYGAGTRDPRIRATVMLGAGDPVAAARAAGIGLADVEHLPAPVPALLVSAEKDLFTRMIGPPGTAYPRLERPKFELTIAGGAHMWFLDGDIWPADNTNPDFLFLQERMPGVAIPGSEERVPLIGPARQQLITLAAAQGFFDAFLGRDAAALGRVLGLPERYPEASLIHAA